MSHQFLESIKTFKEQLRRAWASLEGKHARICGHTRAYASSVSHRIWEGLRRLLAEIDGRRLLEELTDKHATGSGVEEAAFPLGGGQKRPYLARGVEKLRGVESKFNEQDPIFTGATQFRLLFLQDFTRNIKPLWDCLLSLGFGQLI